MTMSAAETAALSSERAVIEQYLEEHGLETALNDVVNEVVKTRPEDPYIHMAEKIRGSSETANSIISVSAREILNGRGAPALEVEVMTQQGSFYASTSTGPYDGDEERFGGLGLRRAAESVVALADALVGAEVLDQEAMDTVLGNVTDAHPNAVLACSVACCRAGAKHAGLAVYEHVAALSASPGAALPMPSVSVLNGGGYGFATKLPFEDISVIPVQASSFSDAVEACGDVARHLQACCAASEPPLHFKGLGAFGGACVDATPAQALKVVLEACRRARGNPNFFKLGLDACAPAYSIPPTKSDDDDEPTDVRYNFDRFDASKAPPPQQGDEPIKGLEPSKVRASDEAKDVFVELLSNFPIISLEDAFDKTDLSAFMKLKERLDFETLKEAGAELAEDGLSLDLQPVGGDEACTVQLVADLLCETGEDVDAFDEHKTINTLCLTLRKGRTVTGACALAARAKARGWGVIVSAETAAGETDDAFVVHLAVGLRAGQIKCGGLSGSEHVSKYNELLRISADKDAPPFVGANFRAVAI
ncbi:enolase C-terminal domain-like protein [Pelagophyceae sp. CCMP2097]|nr:enolase C-terminal domain-like protein [Pelagophyceae sp. CCMP2097]